MADSLQIGEKALFFALRTFPIGPSGFTDVCVFPRLYLKNPSYNVTKKRYASDSPDFLIN